MLLALFPERRSINVIGLALALNVILDPLLEYRRQDFLIEVFIHIGQLWVHLDAIVLLDHHFLAVHLIDHGVVNEELMVAGCQEGRESVVLVAGLFGRSRRLLDAVRHVDIVHVHYVVFDTLVMQDLVPSL